MYKLYQINIIYANDSAKHVGGKTFDYWASGNRYLCKVYIKQLINPKRKFQS